MQGSKRQADRRRNHVRGPPYYRDRHELVRGGKDKNSSVEYNNKFYSSRRGIVEKGWPVSKPIDLRVPPISRGKSSRREQKPPFRPKETERNESNCATRHLKIPSANSSKK